MTRDILDLGSWNILRCAPGSTRRLAESLCEASFEAWTPVETVLRRSRAGVKPEPIRVPITPSYVFAKAEHLLELLALSRSPSLNYQIWDREKHKMVTKGHPHFRLFRHMGEIAAFPDRQLNALRNLERKRTPKPETKALAAGERVRLLEAGFEGLWATVESSKKTYTRVQIDNWMVPVDLPTWTLRQALDAATENCLHESQQALIAKAA